MKIQLQHGCVLMLWLSALVYGQAARKPEVLVQAGHSEVIMSLAFSPDGRICASGSRDTTIKLWDVQTGRLLRTLTGHAGRITSLVFSADGQTLASESEAGTSNADSDGDDTDRLWQVQTGKLLLTTEIGLHAFSPDGSLFAAVAGENKINLWDAHTGQVLRTFAQPTPLASLAFSPDGRRLGASTDSAALDYQAGVQPLEPNAKDKEQKPKPRDKEAERPTLWDVESGQVRARLTGCQTIHFSADGSLIVDDAGRTCDATSGQRANGVEGYLVALSRDGQTGVFWDGREALGVFDIRTTRLLHVFEGYVKGASGVGYLAWLKDDVTFAPDGRTLLLSHTDASGKAAPLELWDTRDWHLIRGWPDRSFVGFSPDSKSLLLTRAVKTKRPDEEQTALELWDVEHGQMLRQLADDLAQGGLDSEPVFSHDGRWLALANDASLELLTLPDGARAHYLQGSSDAVATLTFSADGRQLAVAQGSEVTDAYRYKLWDMRNGSLAHTLEATPAGEQFVPEAAFQERAFVGFSHDGQLFITGDGRVLDAQSLRRARGYAGHISVGTTAYALSGDGHVDIRDLQTGQLRRRILVTNNAYVALSPDDKLLAVSLGLEAKDSHLRLYDAPTGRLLRSFPDVEDLVTNLAFSPDNHLLAVTFGSGSGGFKDNLIFDAATGQRLTNFFTPDEEEASGANKAAFLAFSPDSSMAVLQGCNDEPAANEASEQPTAATPCVVSLHNARDGKQIKKLTTNESFGVLSAAFTPDGKILATGCTDTAIRLWSIETGEQLATLVSFKDNNWLVVTPDGLFDGSADAWNQMLWRFSDKLFDVAPVEWFFNDFYYPGLLADLLAGRRPHANANVAAKDRRQPELQLALANNAEANAPLATRTINLRITITEGAPDGEHEQGGGAQDVRLFRNGSLVRGWHGDVLKEQARMSAGRRSVILEAANVPIVAGENRFTAYAFNHDNIKSADAVLPVRGADSLRRAGTAYILTIGVNHYDNAQYDLKYAVADAQAFGTEVQRQFAGLKAYARVEVRPLFDEAATKPRIMAALAELAQAAQPEDAVVIYFAGHGTAQQNQFYLLPHDLGYTGSRTQLDAAGLQTILAHSISDSELAQAFERLDAGQQLFVIDACNSGQALEAEEKRRGPMNSKGLAQLAYEKGMYILTAAQSFQAAQEAAQLGHGLLTYALIEEGLQQGMADTEPKDGQVWAREWLDYATARVPQMQLEEMKRARGLGLNLSFKDEERGLDIERRSSQRPRVFYRREADGSPLLVARTAAPTPASSTQTNAPRRQRTSRARARATP
jgi:WD40 repeat protein